MSEHETTAPLAGIRVLDLTTSRAELTGRFLAELGADVLKIEPPSGAESRRIGPFDESDGPAHGTSLYWAATGMGKRSAVLDLETAVGREAVLAMASAIDVIVESFAPGQMEALGLGYERLQALNPRLIYASAAPYGQAGPKAAWPASDLTLEASSGRLGLQGDRDRPPIPVGYPQASFHTGGRLAADIVIALNERELSGLGQHLDASMQEAMVLTLMNGTGYPHYTGGDPPGYGDDRAQEPAGPPRSAFLGRIACKDGYVVVTPTSQKQLIASIPASVVPALREAGALPAALDGFDWQTWVPAAQAGEVAPEEMAQAFDAVRSFFLLRKKLELMQWAWQSDVHLGPVNTTRDLLENPHLVEKGYWRKVGPYVHPGPSIRFSRSEPAFGREAPHLGADQALVQEWGRQADGAKASSLRPVSSQERLGEAFADLKVADFSWVAVGPITAKALADHGANVVRIESSTRVDYVRTLQPFFKGQVGINRSHYMNNLNTSKLGVALNLATPEGKALARRLCDWADVIVENFTPGTMQRLGLDYTTLSKDRPELIMISTCLLGQTGPWASFAGYGPHGASIAGLYGVTGWPDRPPCGPNGPYTDVIAPHYTVAALASAIYERRRSGRGQYIDVSQVESAIHFIEPLVLDATVNGRNAGPLGLEAPTACPNGVYSTAGTERYIAISVETAAQWRALLGLVPSLSGFADAGFDEMAARRERKEQIDAAIAAWTAGQDRYELERRLIEAGVPASVVQRPTEVVADPQLKARDFFQVLDHGEIGPTPFDGLMTRFSAKRRMLHKGPPCVGEDTERVMREALGLSDDEIAEYAIKGVFV